MERWRGIGDLECRNRLGVGRLISKTIPLGEHCVHVRVDDVCCRVCVFVFRVCVFPLSSQFVIAKSDNAASERTALLPKLNRERSRSFHVLPNTDES